MDDINTETTVPFISFEKAWAGLKPDLDAEAARRKKRKRRVIFFWFTGIVIGLGFGVYIFENNGTSPHFLAHKKTMESSANSKIESTSSKNLNVVASKTASENIKEKAIFSDANSGTKIIEQSNKAAMLQESVGDIETRISTIGSKKVKALKDVNDIGQHFLKVKSSKNTALNKPNDNDLIESKKTQQAKQKSEIKTIAQKLDNGETDIIEINASNSIVVAKNSADSVKNIGDTAVTKSSIAKTPTSTSKKGETKKTKTIAYGLQWNLPTQAGVNFLDVNTVNKPATLLIPQLLISKQLNKKQSLVFGFNPYAQYYLNNKAVVDFAKYDAIVYSGSQSNTTKPEEITYSEATAFNKLISIEASLMYQYQISSKIKVGLGIGNNWVQAALMQNKVVKNGSLITRDSLYGIDKNDKDFIHLKPSFLVGKFEVEYNIKRFDIGLCFSKPISSPFDNKEYKTPINTNLFVRWMIK